MSNTQYTIRNVPKELDARLRSIAARKKRSLNQVIIDQLNDSIKPLPSKPAKVKHDFEDLIGKGQFDDEFYAALADNRRIHPKDWQ